MHQPVESSFASDYDAEAMRHLVMNTFVGLLQETRLDPMTVLQYAAAAIGSVYREVADAHYPPNDCPCGWQPDELADIYTLQAAVALAALTDRQRDLAMAPVVGHA